jgi:hypothetical protein
MSDESEVRDDRWADGVATRTFLLTVVCAAAFVAAVFIFIL